MHLVQILLPLYDNRGERFGREAYDRLRVEMVEKFGGITAYTRAPATGMWAEEGSGVARDDIVVYEVMVESLDRAWWRAYTERLRLDFKQEELVVRAHAVERL